MDFEFAEEQLMILNTICEFAQAEVAPSAIDYDVKG
jgi:hypothetical protein